jgi:hypothetical protein
LKKGLWYNLLNRQGAGQFFTSVGNEEKGEEGRRKGEKKEEKENEKRRSVSPQRAFLVDVLMIKIGGKSHRIFDSHSGKKRK